MRGIPAIYYWDDRLRDEIARYKRYQKRATPANAVIWERLIRENEEKLERYLPKRNTGWGITNS